MKMSSPFCGCRTFIYRKRLYYNKLIQERRAIMSIALTRIDFRLIHGQVITRWLTQCQINEIVTIDTALSHDDFMQDVFKMAAPKGVKIRILSVEDAVKAQQNSEFEKNRVMVLFKSVQELDNAIR